MRSSNPNPMDLISYLFQISDKPVPKILRMFYITAFFFSWQLQKQQK